MEQEPDKIPPTAHEANSPLPRMEFFKLAWQEELAHMVADPFNRKTMKAFCEEKGMSEQNLYKWKSRNKAEFDAAVEILRKRYKSDIRSKAWKALSNKLEIGEDTTAIKLVFQLLGDYSEKQEIQHNYMTPEDKRRKIEALFNRLKGDKAVEKLD